MNKAILTPEKIKNVFLKKGYKFFENDAQNYNINIIGIRSSDMIPNSFNDIIMLLWKYQGIWNSRIYACTTDPGLYYLQNPINVNGTAIMYPGQYKNAYKVGMHKNYEALEQIGMMKYYRDNDRDKEFDLDETKIYEEVAATNIHHAGEHSVTVANWSAGCCVLANLDDFNDFMIICKESSNIFGNKFTYTLLKESDFNE
jgi:hypothetical protein